MRDCGKGYVNTVIEIYGVIVSFWFLHFHRRGNFRDLRHTRLCSFWYADNPQIDNVIKAAQVRVLSGSQSAAKRKIKKRKNLLQPETYVKKHFSFLGRFSLETLISISHHPKVDKIESFSRFQ